MKQLKAVTYKGLKEYPGIGYFYPQKKFYLFWSNHDYELIKNDKRLRKKYSKVI